MTPYSSSSKWLSALALGLTLATIPHGANAGVGSFLLEKAAEHVLESAKNDNAAPPVALPAGGSFEACRSLFPGGVPIDIRTVDQRWKPRALCASNYAVIYSGLTKTPLLVVERLSRAQLSDALDESRTDEFFHDPRVPKGERAELSDYVGTGLDRGHMAPAADMPNQTAMAQSFALTNMVPQDPHNNRKVWSKIESDTRKYGRRASGDVFVFSGPLFKGQARTIGRNKVWVPTDLFKLVYDASNQRTWAHLLPNTSDARVGQPVDYPTFVRETNWRPLGLPH
tara:strand:- start:776 stop:1624 length:849 start_codon:yes stop_codon:yes gene_type:complete